MSTNTEKAKAALGKAASGVTTAAKNTKEWMSDKYYKPEPSPQTSTPNQMLVQGDKYANTTKTRSCIAFISCENGKKIRTALRKQNDQAFIELCKSMQIVRNEISKKFEKLDTELKHVELLKNSDYQTEKILAIPTQPNDTTHNIYGTFDPLKVKELQKKSVNDIKKDTGATANTISELVKDYEKECKKQIDFPANTIECKIKFSNASGKKVSAILDGHILNVDPKDGKITIKLDQEIFKIKKGNTVPSNKYNKEFTIDLSKLCISDNQSEDKGKIQGNVCDLASSKKGPARPAPPQQPKTGGGNENDVEKQIKKIKTGKSTEVHSALKSEEVPSICE